MLLPLFVIALYVCVMCLMRNELSQADHLFVVTFFAGVILTLASAETQPYIRMIQYRIDDTLGFSPNGCQLQTTNYDENWQHMFKDVFRMVTNWVKEDYKSSQLRRVVRRSRRYIHNKFLC